MQKALEDHLKTGSTTVCRTWSIRRNDGVQLGFTDHDCNLSFEGFEFLATTGLTAGVVEQETGLSIDNTEVFGALSDDSINEEDIFAGRYDGAEVVQYLVNWSNVEERTILFRGSIGEILQSNGSFRIELLSLSDALNQSGGRVYHSSCSAAFGDKDCQVNLDSPLVSVISPILEVTERQVFKLNPLNGFSDGAFVDGRMVVKSGKGKGQSSLIKSDRMDKDTRVVELWHKISQSPLSGDQIQLTVGCDKRASSCRNKFENFLNFRGFPHIPGEDWLRSSPNKRVKV